MPEAVLIRPRNDMRRKVNDGWMEGLNGSFNRCQVRGGPGQHVGIRRTPGARACANFFRRSGQARQCSHPARIRPGRGSPGKAVIRGVIDRVADGQHTAGV